MEATGVGGDAGCSAAVELGVSPAMAVARLSVRDIMGYCVMTWLLSTVLSMLVLSLFG